MASCPGLPQIPDIRPKAARVAFLHLPVSSDLREQRFGIRLHGSSAQKPTESRKWPSPSARIIARAFTALPRLQSHPPVIRHFILGAGLPSGVDLHSFAPR